MERSGSSGSGRWDVPSSQTLIPASGGKKKEKSNLGSWKSELQNKACTPPAEMTARMKALIYDKVVPRSIDGRSKLVEDLAARGETEVLHDLLEKGRISALVLSESLTAKGCSTWAEATRDGCPAIKKLSLHWVVLGVADSRQLLRGLANLLGLTRLQIADCFIEAADDESSHLPELKSLEIVCNAATLPLLGWILRSSIRIDLKVDPRCLDENGHRVLGKMLARTEAVQMLEIDAEVFGAQISVAYQKALKDNSALSCLKVTGSLYRPRVFSLLGGLEKNTGLTKLVLKSCDPYFAKEEAERLGKIVSEGRLLELDLSGNRNINESLPIMIREFGEGARLRSLNLQKTGAGERTIGTLANWLEGNATLTHLWLPKPKKAAHLQPLVDVLSRNQMLLRIHCGRLDPDDEMVQKLGELIHRNRLNRVRDGVGVALHHLQFRPDRPYVMQMPQEISEYIASIVSAEQDDSVLNVALVNHQAFQGIEKQQRIEQQRIEKWKRDHPAIRAEADRGVRLFVQRLVRQIAEWELFDRSKPPPHNNK